MDYVKFVLVLCCCICPGISFTQIRTWQLSLTDSNLSILSADVPNILSIDHLPTGAVLKLSHGMIEPSGHYYSCSTIGYGSDRDTLSIYKGSRIIFSKIFTVTKGFQVVQQLGDVILSGGITIPELSANRVFKVFFAGPFYRYNIPVKSFSISCLRQNIFTGPEANDGNRITDRAMLMLKALKPGDRVFLDDVKATLFDSSVRSLGSFAFVIK